MWLASFIMRRPLNAVLVASVFAILSLVMPPLSLFSGATLALVSLRLGLGVGVKVLLGAGVAVAIFALAIDGSDVSSPVGEVFTVMAIAMLPLLLLLSWVLRETRSLATTVVVTGVLAMVVVVFMYLVVGDTTEWWRHAFSQVYVLAQADGTQQVSPAELEAFVALVAKASNGAAGLIAFLMLAGSVLLARWWQAKLYNPGGFGAEFRGLRFDKRISIAVLLVLGLMIVTEGAWQQFAADLLVVLLAMYMLIGIALVHSVVGFKNAPRAILVALYVLLLFPPTAPQVAVLLASAGFADSWLDLRRRLGISPAPQRNSNDESEDDR